MTTIHKATLEITDVQQVVMPLHSEPLSVAEQNGRLCLWYFVPDTDEQRETRVVTIIGTGSPAEHAPRNGFVGTVLMADGRLVWHVFVD